MKAKYYIKRILIFAVWLPIMALLIYALVKDDSDLNNALADDAFPRYIESAPEAVTFPININTATLRELKALEGIGTAKAEAVIAYREENGGFSSVDELVNVMGIGKATLEKIRPYVTVGG